MHASGLAADTPPRTFRTPPRADIVIHLTPFAPDIPPGANLSAPCRWMRLYNADPVQALSKLCARLARPAPALMLRENAQAEIEVLGRVGDDVEVMAIIVEGLTLVAAAKALAQASRAQ